MPAPRKPQMTVTGTGADAWLGKTERRRSAGENDIKSFSLVSSRIDSRISTALRFRQFRPRSGRNGLNLVRCFHSPYLEGSYWVLGWWSRDRGAGLRAAGAKAGSGVADRLARGACVMAVSDLVNLSGPMDDAKCFAFVRQRRWPEGIRCPACDNDAVIRDGHDDTQPCRQRYRCKACSGRFDDLTGTALAGHHQPLRMWVLCLYFMGLNLSNRQIAGELGLDGSDVQAMTEQLRHGLVAKAPAVTLQDEVEINEVYVVAGHKGQPKEVAKRGGSGAAAGWQAGRRAGPRHVGEGQAARSRPDPARRPSGAAHAGQRATGDDQADHQGCRCPGHPRPYGRIQHLRPPASLGLRAQDGLPRARRVCPRRGQRGLLRGSCQHHGGFWSLLRS